MTLVVFDYLYSQIWTPGVQGFKFVILESLVSSFSHLIQAWYVYPQVKRDRRQTQLLSKVRHFEIFFNDLKEYSV